MRRALSGVDGRSLRALVRRGVVFELRLYRGLARWVCRRPDTRGAEVESFGYAQAVSPVLWLWIFASAVELVVVHLLVPWETVRLVLDMLGVWGLIWMLGLLASLRVYPHLLGESVLRVRYGASTDIAVRWTAVAGVVVRRRDLASSARTLQPRETETGTDLQVGVSGQVNVHAVLREPVTVPTAKGDLEITALSFLADDPRALVARARERLTPEIPSRT